MRSSFTLFNLVGVLVLASSVVACSSTSDPASPPSDLSPAAAVGWSVARNKGCMSCHGLNGEGGIGPSWDGIAGSVRELEDGTTVIADRTYLETALRDPRAQTVAGFTLSMPLVRLTDAEVTAIVDYLEELA